MLLYEQAGWADNQTQKGEGVWGIRMLSDIVHKMVMRLTADDIREIKALGLTGDVTGILSEYERLVAHWGSGAYGEIDGKTWTDVRGRLDELRAALHFS